MLAELTPEEAVTKLLTSNEILKTENCSYITTPCLNLADFLESQSLESEKEPSEENSKDSKYTFIKLGGWGF